ncbi:MAG: allantoicase [Saprospiraceae bacterium]|jgi:allantoicase
MQSTKLNLASARMGAIAHAASDDSFAAKERMLQDHSAVFVDEKYDDYGKWMDGWESRRRRNADHDWAIVKLAATGTIDQIDIDTRHFTGNYPPAASIEACLSDNAPDDGTVWEEIVSVTALGPDASHLVDVSNQGPWNWVRVNMWSDGGIARLRVYGDPISNLDKSSNENELSGALNGGKIIAYNNAHYGNIHALLYPDTGIDMGDGWETRRRREPGFDWVIIELGQQGIPQTMEIDTKHNKGNYPDGFSINAMSTEVTAKDALVAQSIFWPELLSRQALSADSVHTYSTADLLNQDPITHLRLNIYPDGGISRFRLFGSLA